MPNIVAPTDAAGVARNIELKARLDSLADAITIAESLATETLGTQRQCDTYFACRRGRLKLREIEDGPAQLISYERANHKQARQSEYCLVDVPDRTRLKTALTMSLGVLTEVRKTRRIFLWHNVRIHLDQVENLGDFLEFEAVLTPPMTDQQGQQQVAELSSKFHILPDRLLDTSYGDMMLID